MLYIIIIFLLVSVYLYCLLGGADFGAGIVELFSKGENKKRISSSITGAMAPIWEANHMWLIITIVILFNAFPTIYSRISISLYIPLILLLLGIVFRGCAFTFRHYDAVKEPKTQAVYSRIFAYSSFFVTFFFGTNIGAIASGKIHAAPSGFPEGYIFPWFNIFSISIGLFLCALFSSLAAVFLIGDADPNDKELKALFKLKSKQANIATVVTGGLVFIASFIEQVNFAESFFTNTASMIFIVLATVSLPLLWQAINKELKWRSRIIAGAQLLFILGAFYSVYFPTIVHLGDADDLTLFNSHAPDATLDYLGWALIIGSFIIFPSLYYLYKIFKIDERNEKAGAE